MTCRFLSAEGIASDRIVYRPGDLLWKLMAIRRPHDGAAKSFGVKHLECGVSAPLFIAAERLSRSVDGRLDT